MKPVSSSRHYRFPVSIVDQVSLSPIGAPPIVVPREICNELNRSDDNYSLASNLSVLSCSVDISIYFDVLVRAAVSTRSSRLDLRVILCVFNPGLGGFAALHATAGNK